MARPGYARLVLLLMSLGLLAISITFMGYVIAPAGAVWRGDVDRMPHLPRDIPVSARTYFAYLLWIVPLNVGIALFSLVGVIGSLMGPDWEPLRPLFVVSVGLILGSLPLVLGHLSVALLGRPRFLIAPPYRHQRPRWLSTRARP